MIKAFLSHSSKDKSDYVRKVAEWLGKDNIVYDEFTFEEGEKTLDEILGGLDSSELFVLFISKNALNSEWVKKEITEAKIRLDESSIKKIYPIIIEDGITYEDHRIPDWIKDNYNLKPIKRSHVAARRIHTKLRDLAWSKHPILEKKHNLFVGRNDKLDEFEERIHDFDSPKPFAIIVSGMPGIGRRTFLHKALFKTNVTENIHKPSSLILDRNVSIEDFILKLNDLGLLDLGDEISSLTEKTIPEKIDIIHKIMRASYESKEIIYLVDDGCLVNYKREISKWFHDTISSYKGNDYPIFCLASRYGVRFNNRPRDNKYYFIDLNELNPKERRRLLSQLLEIYGVEVNKKDFEDISHLLFGLPEQVMFAAELVREDNSTPIHEKLPVLQEYNADKAAVLLRRYDNNEQVLDFIRLLAQFEVISTDFVFSIVPEEIFYPILEELGSEHIIELIGTEGEFVRLNDVIRDYIKRNRFSLKKEYERKIQEQVSIIANGDDILERDSSEYIFTLKESLRLGIKVDNKLLIPSHYLRCMKDIYYSKGRLDRIIELADIILQKKETLDPSVVQDISYYLCLALAKKSDDRLLKEVQSIKGDEHNFLLGFYYRLKGRYSDALSRYEKIIDAPYVAARAKREIVQVYVNLEEYDKALSYAKNNYEENKGNQFHTQAYFNCLVNSSSPEKHRDLLKSLIDNLRRIDSKQSNEMADIAESLYYAKAENNKHIARDKAEDCVKKYPGNHYPVLAFCDIALKYRDIGMLEEGYNKLVSLSSDKHIPKRTLNRYKAFLLALHGKEYEALNILEKDIARYPEESRQRIIGRIKEYSSESGRA